MRSTEILQLLAKDGGGSLVYQLGFPQTNYKSHSVTIKRADGHIVDVLPGDYGRSIIDDFLHANLIYEAAPFDEEWRCVYRPTPDGLARGTRV